MKPQKKAYIYALSAVMLWSTVATAFKIALYQADYFQLLFYSSFTAFIFLFILLIINGKIRNLQNIRPKDIGISALAGILNPFLYYLILFKAYSILPAQEAMALNYTWPLMIVLFSIPVLKQKLRGMGVLSILVSFFGVLLIAMKGNMLEFRFTNPLGDLLAVGSSLIWASFWMINLKNKIDDNIKLFLSFGFGTLFSFIVCMFYSSLTISGIKSISSLIYVGLAEMGITFFLWSNALKLSDRTDKISQTIFLSPVLSLMIINLVLGEKLHWSTPVGLGMILAGIFLNTTFSHSTKK